jgi:DNA-binding NarL/FixJ family response regulator
MKRVQLIVVDDHALFRAGLIGLLQDMPEFNVIGEAANGLEAIELIEKKKPDIVLLDVNMPIMNGVEVVQNLSRSERPKIIMLTISKQDEDLFGAIAAGADGYILKNTEPDDLRKAIIQVYEGKAILSPEITKQVLSAVANIESILPDKGLSRRELEVLTCLARGMTTSQIAEELFISDNTAKTHIRHILEKLDASNRAEAVSKATQIGLIKAT